jgi:Toprim domain
LISELKRTLVERMEDLLPMILRDVHCEANDLVGWARDGTKFKVVVRGRKRGFVLDTSDPHGKGPGRRGGNLFNLVTHELGNGTAVGGILAAKRLLGMRSDPALIARDPDAERQAAAVRIRDATARVQEMVEDTACRRRMAWETWDQALPMTPETPAWRYLDARDCALPSDALRSGRRWHSGAKAEFDVMVAAVIHPITGRFLGIHVTYLECSGGVCRKANVTPAKITFAPTGGGIIPLLCGASDPLISEAQGEEVLIGEGIENCLSAATRFPELRCWSGISVGNLLAIEMPRQFLRIRLIHDRDGENESVRRTREKLIRRWLDEGRSLRPLAPPPGFKDLNDWCRASQAQRRRAQPHNSAPQDRPVRDASDAA